MSAMRKLLACAIVLFWPLVSAADDDRIVSHARLKVADVARAEGDVGAVDLGPAPPPGGSRIISRGEVLERVRTAGLDPRGLKLRASVRVVSASLRLTPDALVKLATPAIAQVLPEGVALAKVDATHDVITHPGTTVRGAIVPRIPHQKGSVPWNATLELASDDGVVTKVPLGITLEVSEAAARADVPRGARIEVVLERGAIKIATTGTAMADADVGDTTQISLVSTGRVVHARVVSRERVEIVERP